MNKVQKLYVFSLVPTGAILALAIYTNINQRMLNASQESRYASYLLANELRNSSEDLTRLARTYVVTGDLKYEEQYWDVLAVRGGKKPRPDGRAVALRKLMEDQGFTAEEFAMLKQAEDNSNGLVTTETVAMNAVKGQFADGAGGFTRRAAPDLEMARRIMHNDKYHQDKALIMAPIVRFEEMLDRRTKASVETYRARGTFSLALMLAFTAITGLVVAIGLRRFAAVMRKTGGEMLQAAEQVADAASRLTESSQSVALGATRQAAAVEQTTASTEEISAMARRNESNSSKVAGEMDRTASMVTDANARLEQMVASMNEITDSSTKISRIIRVIDEIAFQTNILALNAAVEAARAGQAGLGFAVVAEEVRNLAQRSASAAKDTATMIEDSIAKSTVGRKHLDLVVDAIKGIITGSVNVKALVDEVNRGSQEQSRGIAQISQAIVEVEQVTRKTAAAGEEFASSAEQLHAQSEALTQVVERLTEMVGAAN